MKLQIRLLITLAWIAFTANASAQSEVLPLQISPASTLWNYQSLRGVPISALAGLNGSDGRLPTTVQGNPLNPPVTTNQFAGLVAFGGVPGLLSNAWSTLTNYPDLVAGTNPFSASVAVEMQLPLGHATSEDPTSPVVLIMRQSRIGVAYFGQQITFPFGSVIAPPLTDENGLLLASASNTNYWAAQPYFTANLTDAAQGFYWSPNALAVFAVQTGPISVTWVTAAGSSVANPPAYTNASGASTVGSVITNGGTIYKLFTQQYLVSGSPVKTPQQIYWTEGNYAASGHPVTVPRGNVSQLKIIYNNNFPRFVAAPGDLAQVLPNYATNTLWFDTTLNEIRADNAQGLVFMELLGEQLASGNRRFLGLELVNVNAAPSPVDISVELGTRVGAFPGGADDSYLTPSPLTTASFYYKQNLPNGVVNLYATAQTVNLTDFQCYWLISGVAGLQWPYVFDRYSEYWPQDPSHYVNYARPYVTTAAQAAATAVQLPASEAPAIAFQDIFTNRAPASLDSSGKFYTYLDLGHPAHRTLLQFFAGNNVFYERVFSWLDLAMDTNFLFAGSVATNLTAWNPTNQTLQFATSATGPYVITNTVNVGDRIVAPVGELGSAGTNYLAGAIVQSTGTDFNPNAYVDPFGSGGFSAANQGAIIPVNSVPGNRTLEVMWFRTDNAPTALGFQPSYWPAVIGYYNAQWPAQTPNQIILASNAGSGPLNSLGKPSIYAQNNPALPGYNPNEEHALILGGTAYALRDDLNQTNGPGYTSAPFVLIQYVQNDLRPAMLAFQVRREAPEQGILFDYVVNAGTILQAPMPLPLLTPPVMGAGASATNFNTEPPNLSGDLPANWSNLPALSPLSYYGRFTYQDRKHNFWVYRGLHSGLPTLQVGAYSTSAKTFGPLPGATAVRGTPFNYYLHCSRQSGGLTIAPPTPSLPPGLSIGADTTNGLSISGVPQAIGANTYTLTFTDTDGSVVSATLSLNVVSSGAVVAQGPLAITSTNQYSAATVTYSNRPPALAAPPTPTNSFTMRFYYVNQSFFDWPGVANAPTNGAIVPYLLPATAGGGFNGDPTSSGTPSLNIVYRPTWPSIINNQPVPTLYSGQTLTTPINNLAEVRGQGSAQVLYQQSIAVNDITRPLAYQSVNLFDPTVEKTSYLPNVGLSNIGGSALGVLPPTVVATYFQGLYFFPNLPPNLVNRIWLDPNTTNLVFKGQFEQQAVGDNYVFLNVLNGADLAAVRRLCLPSDNYYPNWTNAVASLSAQLFTFGEATTASGNPIPGTYVAKTNLTQTYDAGHLVSVTNVEQQVDSYALGATGPGLGYISYIVGNSINPAHSGDPVTVYVARVAEYVATTNPPGLYPGQLVTVYDPNPLSELISFQHTLDLGGNSGNYQYDWRIVPAMNGLAPTGDPSTWPVMINGVDVAHFTLGGAVGIQSLSDNFIALRYREIDVFATPANTNWSAWTTPTFAPGYIKRVLTGINPFEQKTSDLFNNAVNTGANILTTAGHRWEGDVALNPTTLTNAGLIQIYETVLHRGEALSINGSPGINFGPANDALLLAAGEISDLYTYIANDAAADAANPTIGIGTDNTTYGSVATALFSFQGEEPSLLEEELALLRGRDDSVTSVTLPPVYNRLYWNYTHGIASGEVIYALNYNILDQNNDGRVDASDAAILYPMGHGDAYGHYLTALNNYYQLLLNPNFDWVPQAETVSILGASVAVNYEHERKFAAASGALAKTGLQVFDLTWREGYTPGTSQGWSAFDTVVTNASPRTYQNGGSTQPVARYWGLDHWAARTYQGAYLNWVVGNAILPPVDPNPYDQGIQKVDRTTVPELAQLPQAANQLQSDMDNAEAGFTPFNLSQNAIPFDINPLEVTGTNPKTHFEQIYERAVAALNNAVVAFNDAQAVTEEMRSQENSLADFQAGVVAQELAYNNQLIELYGTPYPDDMGPAGTYPQGYAGPDLIHYTYVADPNTNLFGGILADPRVSQTFNIDIQQLPPNWSTTMYANFDSIIQSTAPGYNANASLSVPLVIGPNGFFDKPATWTSERSSPGQIQQAISTLIAAQDALRQSALAATIDKGSLDKAETAFKQLVVGNQVAVSALDIANEGLSATIQALTTAYNIYDESQQYLIAQLNVAVQTATLSVPEFSIVGVAVGGDQMAPLRGITFDTFSAFPLAAMAVQNVVYDQAQGATLAAQLVQAANNIAIDGINLDTDIKNAVMSLGQQELALQGDVVTITGNMRKVSDAQAAYQALVAKGLRIQSDRATWRQHAAALVQGYRTSDAAFRLFQNEKLERYLALFKLAGEYAYLSAQAYDYETGLLGTKQGQAFLNKIISAQAVGVVSGGQPQYSSSSSGDPGLAGALAAMKGDWDVLKGRLGFNNPDGYGTTVSLRAENYRVLHGTNGDLAWQQVLQNGLTKDVTADADVKRLCLQIGNHDGSPVPGIILNFSTIIQDGLNLFGNTLAPGDNHFSSSSFATKIFSVGVCLDGYVGMNNPALNGGITVGDPTLDPNGLAQTPYVYLIPVGQDSMRSPPLGDASEIRSWNVDDVAVPLPFNISAANFAGNLFYNSASSLSEPLFSVRGHQSFRPVSTTSVFNTSIYGSGGSLQPSQYSNRRLIGRSIWNSQWKLVIPGKELLNDPNLGLSRFINSVKDIKLYFITYSYAGN